MKAVGRARLRRHSGPSPRSPSVNAPPSIQRRPSVCPHDCPSACALEVEVIDGDHHRPRPRRQRPELHGRRDLRQGRPLRRAHPPSRPADSIRCAAPAPRARASSSASPGTRRWTRSPRRFLADRGRAWAGDRLALLLRRHHGARACATASTACAMPSAIPASISTICTDAGLDRLHRRHRAARRGRPARDGQVRLRRDLGHQRGAHPGQRDDPRHHARASERGAKIVVIDIYRNATMEQADLALVLRPGTDGALACARDARAVPRRPRRPRLSRRIHRRPRRARGASRDAARRNGPPRSPGSPSRRSRTSPALVGTHTQHLSSGSATASRASATARSTCTRRSASRR